MEAKGRIDLDQMFYYCEDLGAVLRDDKDVGSLDDILRGTDSLRDSSVAHLDWLSSSIQDLQRKIESFKDKTEAARAEVVADSELDLLQKELDEVLRKEKSLIEDSRYVYRWTIIVCATEIIILKVWWLIFLFSCMNTVIASEIKDLDQQRASIEERKCALKKLEKQGLRERMMLSMYASVTTVIPILTDDSNVSGYVVDRKKNVVDRFQFGSASTDTCESIWKMIDEQKDRVK